MPSCSLCVAGELVFYQTVMSLCRAISQYLLSLSKLPASQQIPADKEALMVNFAVLALEVCPGRVDHTPHSLSSPPPQF